MDIILKTTGCGTVINSLANLFKKLDSYALEQDVILKGYASLIKITDDMFIPTQNQGMPYTYEEIDTIWNYEGKLIADITLSTIYAGTRIEELLFTKTVDVNIEKGYFVAGLKTGAGRRRVIPIHPEIKHIFNKYYNPNNEFLFTIDGKKIDYNSQFLPMYNEFMESLGMNHESHDGRRTLRAEFDRLIDIKLVSENCVNKILGHKTGDVGKDVYSPKYLEELQETIKKIDYRSKKNTKITYIRACS